MLLKKEKQQLRKIRRARIKADKSFQNRALMVIETLCGDDIVIKDINQLKEDIYKIAHSAIEPKTCNHDDWIAETEKRFKRFKKLGLL